MYSNADEMTVEGELYEGFKMGRCAAVPAGTAADPTRAAASARCVLMMMENCVLGYVAALQADH
jgi:hypothetical protein